MFETIQPNGRCWDCGSYNSRALVKLHANKNTGDDEIAGIGWECQVCGRWWPVMISDLENWVDKKKAFGLLRNTPIDLKERMR